MNLQLNLYQAPWHHVSHRDALAFARASLARGDRIERVFFFMDAVYIGLTSQSPASDEVDMRQAWLDLAADAGCELLLCIAASANRGLLNDAEAERYQSPITTVAEPFQLVGLGQWALGYGDSDKVVSFR
ncbi:sulfurtransferase complex subunit TusD [Saccharospirillum impatiens]|uniref:sulfurtransferase complex subunit TusD n=1 Tax=Saccharospirillum impatiens TaxID=169438 RepID=UPI0004210AB4|nr:sulfurtransferase complex subunit TusD [Saccharospirillum impatiens]